MISFSKDLKVVKYLMSTYLNIKTDINYHLKTTFLHLQIINSPFKLWKLKFHIGSRKIGTPIFFPRKAVRLKDRPGYLTFVPKKIGFDFVGLGWKTKWEDTDYRFEWNPVWSFVVFNFQIAITFKGEDSYWTSFLYYINNTDKNLNKYERIAICIEEFPLIFQKYTYGKPPIQENRYYKILKRKYQDIIFSPRPSSISKEDSKDPKILVKNLLYSKFRLEEDLTDEQISEAFQVYTRHKNHINKIVTELFLPSYPPSDPETVNNSILWKPEHWKWFLNKYD